MIWTCCYPGVCGEAEAVVTRSTGSLSSFVEVEELERIEVESAAATVEALDEVAGHISDIELEVQDTLRTSGQYPVLFEVS